MDNGLTEKQINAIRCAHADLIGALEAQEQGSAHDWNEHEKSIDDLEREFPDIFWTCSTPKQKGE